MRKNIFLLGALLAVSAATMAQVKQGASRADALADRENAEDIGCRQGALQCHRCQQYRRLGEEPCQCRSCRHSLQRGDSCAAHPQSEELWPLLDVQRHERAACQLRQAHADSLAVEFSQDYLFFYDQLEKANLMLQGVIDHARKSIEDPQVQFFFKSPLNDGGTFCGVATWQPSTDWCL